MFETFDFGTDFSQFTGLNNDPYLGPYSTEYTQAILNNQNSPDPEKGKAWGNILNGFQKYGMPVLQSLLAAGVFKKQSDILSGNIDQQAYQAYLANAGNDLNPANYTNTSFFEQNKTLIIVLIIAAFGFLVFMKK